jgi:uncharacterized protein (UPF0332 family)
MFYVAEAFLLNKGLAFGKHSAVIAAFGEHFTKTGIVPPEFHRYLMRVDCRYAMQETMAKLGASPQKRQACRLIWQDDSWILLPNISGLSPLSRKIRPFIPTPPSLISRLRIVCQLI